VRIRAEGTHAPVPGVAVGDIGPKLGFAAVDNGFLRFDRLSLPVSCLLGACGAIGPDGAFAPPAHPKLAYAGMMAVRVHMVSAAPGALALAATVAVRYSALRLQFAQDAAPADASLRRLVARPGGAAAAQPIPGRAGSADGDEADAPRRETAVLDYALQRRRVLGWAALAWALRAAGASLGSWHADVMSALRGAGGDGSAELASAELGTLHGLAAALKSASTSLAAEGMEECRRACGGHGYSDLAGIAPAWRSFVHTCTAEGDNGVMLLQAGRAVLRAREAAGSAGGGGALPGPGCGSAGRDHLAYLGGEGSDAASLVASLHDAEALAGPGGGDAALALLRAAARAAADAALAAGGGSAAASLAAPAAQPAVAGAALAHAHAALQGALSEACARLDAATREGAPAAAGGGGAGAGDAPVPMSAAAAGGAVRLCPGVAVALRSVSCLSGLVLLRRSLPILADAGIAGRGCAAAVDAATDALCSRLRPVAVSLVDGCGVHDHVLSSAIGRRDGAAYEGMWLWAQRSSLGDAAAGPVDRAFGATLRPMMREGAEAVAAAERAGGAGGRDARL